MLRHHERGRAACPQMPDGDATARCSARLVMAGRRAPALEGDRSRSGANHKRYAHHGAVTTATTAVRTAVSAVTASTVARSVTTSAARAARAAAEAPELHTGRLGEPKVPAGSTGRVATNGPELILYSRSRRALLTDALAMEGACDRLL